MQMLLKCDAWGTGETAAASRAMMSISRLEHDVSAWQKQQARLKRDVTFLRAMKPETFGSWAKPRCDLKGAETNWLLEYIVTIFLVSKGHLLGDDLENIQTAGQCLFNVLSLIRKYSRKFPVAAVQSFHENTRMYLSSMEQLGLRFLPKDHMFVEMSLRCRELGSPALYGNWLDESVNRLLKDVAAGAHSLVHERRTLAEFPKAFENDRKRRKLR